MSYIELCRYKVHAYSSGAIEDSGASVSVYGVGKKPIEFVINKDGEVVTPLLACAAVSHAIIRRCIRAIGMCSTSKWTNKAV